MRFLEEFKAKLSAQGVADWTNRSPTLEYFWRFELEASREVLWNYLADTSRFNRELGFDRRQQTEIDGQVFVSTRMLFWRQEWLEEPWAWVNGETIVSSRVYSLGMAETVYSVFRIDESPASGKRVVSIYFGWRPKHWGWRRFLKLSEGVIRGKFEKAFAKIDRQAKVIESIGEQRFAAVPASLAPEAFAKLEDLRSGLIGQGLNPRAVNGLCDHVAGADELDLEKIRVLPLAKKWEVPDRDLLSTCLHATRSGLLKLSWEVICPHCRGSRFSATDLGSIPESSSCDVCDIEFKTDEANSIEVIFHVQESVRKVEPALYCAAEPAKKKHIKLQRRLGAGERLQLRMDLPQGAYRFRSGGSAREVRFNVTAGEPPYELNFTNAEANAVDVIVEELWWESTALRPAQILAMPEFRDLFAEEHLNSNVKLFLGEQTILFTDIVGSTKYYSDVGDAKAFAGVRAHFLEVYEEVRKAGGVVVKTIGDSVMAAFGTPEGALASAVAIQALFHHDRTDTPIRLRISVHCGPVIAVQLNTGLDYFGSTVNFAAKTQSVAGACEIALSDEIRKRLASVLAGCELEKRKSARDGVVADIYVLKTGNVIRRAS